MKVEFSYQIFALYLRYSRLNHPIGNPHSNLVALTRAEEYSNTIREFNRNISSQNHQTEIEKGRRLWRFSKKRLLLCYAEGRRAAFEIAKFDSHRGMFSSCGGVKGHWVGPESRNWARKGSAVVEIFEKSTCRLVSFGCASNIREYKFSHADKCSLLLIADSNWNLKHAMKEHASG